MDEHDELRVGSALNSVYWQIYTIYLLAALGIVADDAQETVYRFTI